MYLLETTKKRMVGESRFELPTSCSQGRRVNQAALLPDLNRWPRQLGNLQEDHKTVQDLFAPTTSSGESRFELPVRPPHLLGGVPTVAPYSSRRHPPAPRQAR